MEDIIKPHFQCPVCSRYYGTVKEAQNCSKAVLDYFSEGDVVHYKGEVWEIYFCYDHLSIRRVEDYITAKGLIKKEQARAEPYPGSKFCKDTIVKLTEKEVSSLRYELLRRLKACEKLLEKIRE